MKKFFQLLVRGFLVVSIVCFIVSCSDGNVKTVTPEQADLFAKSMISDAEMIYKAETASTRSEEYSQPVFWKVDKDGNHSQIKIATKYGKEIDVSIRHVQRLGDRYLFYDIPHQKIDDVIGYEDGVEIRTDWPFLQDAILLVDKETNSIYQTTWTYGRISGNKPLEREVKWYTDKNGNIYFYAYWDFNIVYKFDPKQLTFEEYTIAVNVPSDNYTYFDFVTSDNGYCLYYAGYTNKTFLRHPNGVHQLLGMSNPNIIMFKYDGYIHYWNVDYIMKIDDSGNEPQDVEVLFEPQPIRSIHFNKFEDIMNIIYYNDFWGRAGLVREFDGTSLKDVGYIDNISGTIYNGESCLFIFDGNKNEISVFNLIDYSTKKITLDNYRIDDVSVSGDFMSFSGLDYFNNGKKIIGNVDKNGVVSIVSTLENNSKITNLIKLN